MPLSSLVSARILHVENVVESTKGVTGVHVAFSFLSRPIRCVWLYHMSDVIGEQVRLCVSVSVHTLISDLGV